MGCVANVEHKVDTQCHAPFKARPIQSSCVGDEKVTYEIQKLLDRCLLINSNSLWSLPMLIVKKKDGTNCVVIDYRCLNNITKKDNYPLPCIVEALDRLGGARYFSAVDLVFGY